MAQKKKKPSTKKKKEEKKEPTFKWEGEGYYKTVAGDKAIVGEFDNSLVGVVCVGEEGDFDFEEWNKNGQVFVGFSL